MSSVSGNQVDLFLDRIMDAPFKDDMAVMEHPFFSLQKSKRTKPFVYERGGVTIRVEPGHDGMATIWDKDILMYLASILNQKIENGETPSPVIKFNVHDFLVSTNRGTGKAAYDRFKAAAGRLLGTIIKTDIESAGVTDFNGFGWIKSYKGKQVTGSNGRKMTVWVEIELNDWMYRALVHDRRVLSINPEYFNITGGLERRLYELARKHTGGDHVWEIGIGALQEKCGSTATATKFKFNLKSIQEQNSLLDYVIQVHEKIQDPSKFLMNFRKGTTVVTFTPRNMKPKAIPDSPSGSEDTESNEPEILSPAQGKLMASADAFESARAQAPGWDINHIERQWQQYCGKKKARIHNPDAAFLAFVREYVRQREENGTFED